MSHTSVKATLIFALAVASGACVAQEWTRPGHPRSECVQDRIACTSDAQLISQVLTRAAVRRSRRRLAKACTAMRDASGHESDGSTARRSPLSRRLRVATARGPSRRKVAQNVACAQRLGHHKLLITQDCSLPSQTCTPQRAIFLLPSKRRNNENRPLPVPFGKEAWLRAKMQRP